MPARCTSPPRPRPVREPVRSGTAEIVPDRDRPYGATLYVDGTPQSHVDLSDPTYLEFEYVRYVADVLDLAFPPGPLRVLHLGGGALTLPRYVAATRPRSRQQVAESDADLVALVRRELPVPAGAGVRVTGCDAGELLRRSAPGSYDAVVLDAYAGARMPAALACRETLAAAARVLVPAGVLAVNLADGGELAFTRSMVATARDVLPVVAAIADQGAWRGRRFANIVLVGACRPLPQRALVRRLAGGPFPARYVEGGALAAFASGAPVVTAATAVASPPPPRDAFGH